MQYWPMQYQCAHEDDGEKRGDGLLGVAPVDLGDVGHHQASNQDERGRRLCACIDEQLLRCVLRSCMQRTAYVATLESTGENLM